MSRGWFLALAVSLGLNAGLLWMHFSDGAPPWRDRPGPSAMRPPGARFPERLAEFHLERMTRELDLTDEQQGALRALLSESTPRLTAIRARMVSARDALADAYRGSTLDESAIRTIVSGLNRTKVELDSLTAELLLQEAALLTPEQRERYADVMPFGPDRGGPPGPGFGRDGGPPHGRGGPAPPFRDR